MKRIAPKLMNNRTRNNGIINDAEVAFIRLHFLLLFFSLVHSFVRCVLLSRCIAHSAAMSDWNKNHKYDPSVVLFDLFDCIHIVCCVSFAMMVVHCCCCMAGCWLCERGKMLNALFRLNETTKRYDLSDDSFCSFAAFVRLSLSLRLSSALWLTSAIQHLKISFGSSYNEYQYWDFSSQCFRPSTHRHSHTFATLISSWSSIVLIAPRTS